MAMHVTTLRFSDDLWQMLDREAKQHGVSVAQLVRDAAILRVAALAAQRGDREAVETVEDLAARSQQRRRPAPPDPAERERLRALRATGLLDSPPDEAFDRIGRVAASVLNAPVALVSLLDENRQFFKSCIGLKEPWASSRQTPLTHSFCQHAVRSRKPLVIEDARQHRQLRDNLAIRDLDVIAYLGVPLVDPDGHALGTLCVIDNKPRAWTREQVQLVRDLAASALTEIEAARTRGAGTARRPSN